MRFIGTSVENKRVSVKWGPLASFRISIRQGERSWGWDPIIFPWVLNLLSWPHDPHRTFPGLDWGSLYAGVLEPISSSTHLAPHWTPWRLACWCYEVPPTAHSSPGSLQPREQMAPTLPP